MANSATDNSIGSRTYQGPGEPAGARNKRPFEAARLEDLPDINTEKTEDEFGKDIWTSPVNSNQHRKKITEHSLASFSSSANAAH